MSVSVRQGVRNDGSGVSEAKIQRRLTGGVSATQQFKVKDLH